MTKEDLINTLEAAGWMRDFDGDYVLVNGYVRIYAGKAVIGDVEARLSRIVSYERAAAWATGNFEQYHMTR